MERHPVFTKRTRLNRPAKGTVMTVKARLLELEKKAQERDDYIAAIKDPQLQELRNMAIRSLRKDEETSVSGAYARGILQVFEELGAAILRAQADREERERQAQQ